MKPTKPSIQKMLFACIIMCSLFCSIYMNSVLSKQHHQIKNVTPNQQVEEVLLPDVFAAKNLIEKILKYLPAS